jgi:hypothetical protein
MFSQNTFLFKTKFREGVRISNDTSTELSPLKVRTIDITENRFVTKKLFVKRFFFYLKSLCQKSCKFQHSDFTYIALKDHFVESLILQNFENIRKLYRMYSFIRNKPALRKFSVRKFLQMQKNFLT